MKRTERAAKEALERRGFITTTKGVALGNMKDEKWDPPTTVLKHGPIARLFGSSPKEVKGK